MGSDPDNAIAKYIMAASIAIGSAFLTLSGNYVLTGTKDDKELVRTVANIDTRVSYLSEQIRRLDQKTDTTPASVAVIEVRLQTLQLLLDKNSHELEQLRSSVVPDSIRTATAKK